MRRIFRIIKGILTPRKLGRVLLEKISPLIRNDKWYLRQMFYVRLGYKPNFDNPVTFNEKLNWLKLYDRNPLYTSLVDKYLVKQFVEDRIGKEHVIPTIDVWDKTADINPDKLPAQFVLKTTHGGGSSGVVIVKDKEKCNFEQVFKKLDQSLKTDLFVLAREWPYKRVNKRIIAEPYVEDEKGELHDFKFFCFNGKVEFFKIDFDRFCGHKANYYGRDLMPRSFREENYPSNFSKINLIPDNIEEMFHLAETLSAGIPFVRVDLYNVSGVILFGEMTFYPAAGFCRFSPAIADNEIGDLLLIPSKKLIEGEHFAND